MTLLQLFYKLTHRNATEIPYEYNITLWNAVRKIHRKWMSVVIIPSCPFNHTRVWLYKLIGYKIGKNVFIGMRCYLDDLCYDLLEIEDNVIISYGVYFAHHGVHQSHNHIVIRKGAYIGMRSTIIAPTDIVIGENAIIGANSLVNKSVADNDTVVGIPAKPITCSRARGETEMHGLTAQ